MESFTTRHTADGAPDYLIHFVDGLSDLGWAAIKVVASAAITSVGSFDWIAEVGPT